MAVSASSCLPDPDPIDPVALLGPAGFAMVEHQAEADSTMVRAREIAADPLCLLPAAVIADRQTHGRGRRGASWWQPPGSLAVSIVLDATAAGTEAAAAPPPSWSLACGVAIAETLRALDPDVQAMVRWPNDIEVQGRKLAGILVETAGCGRAIFGIGVNTTGIAAAAPVPLRARVATFPDLTGRSLPRERLLVAFLPRFLGLLRGMAADEGILAARYRPLCSLDGHAVTIHAGDGRHHGLCRGIAGDGALVLDTPSGRMRLVSGSLTDPADVWRGDWNS